MRNIMPFIKGNKKVLLGVYLILGCWIYAELYYGESFFYTTAYTYSLVGLISYYLFKRLNISANIALSWFTLLIALFAAEFTLRYIIRYPLSYGEQNGDVYILTDRYRQYENLWMRYVKGRADLYTPAPDSGEIVNNDVGDYHYANDTLNALGFRGKLPDKRRKIILAMGASFTEGCGAPADSSIPALLRTYITAHDTGTDLINCGVSGSDIFFDWKMLQKLAVQYPVKQVVFILNSSDVNDVGSRGGNERFTDNSMLRYQPRPRWEPAFAVSYVLRLFVMKILKVDFNLTTPEQALQTNASAVKKIKALFIDEILPWAKTKNIDVVIVTLPVGHELHTADHTYLSMLNALQQLDSCKVIDCLPMLNAQANPKGLYWPHDLHYKPEGYQLVAAQLIDSCYR